MDYGVDPLFQKMSAAFDEGGAKGMLLNTLSIGAGCEIIFDSNTVFDEVCSSTLPVCVFRLHRSRTTKKSFRVEWREDIVVRLFGLRLVCFGGDVLGNHGVCFFFFFFFPSLDRRAPRSLGDDCPLDFEGRG